MIDQDALFLSFNYTPDPLERIYGVSPERILRIHGRASDPADNLILGHGWERSPEDRLNARLPGPTTIGASATASIISRVISLRPSSRPST